MAFFDVGQAIIQDSRPRRLGSSAKLCALCQRINVQTLSEPGGYQHNPQARDIVASAENCPLCERFILRPLGVTYSMHHGAAIGPLSCSLVGDHGFKWLQLSTETWMPEPDMRQQTGRLLALRLFTDAGDPAAAYGVATRRIVQGTSSASSTETARQWVRTCVEQHGCSHWLTSSRSPELLGQRPSRLIDVLPFEDDPTSVRLLDGNNASTYVTLSHCWGKEPLYKTTSENLAEHLTRIQCQNLPQTFKDAIKITRDLGYRYLWIDALCIIQGDDKDWAAEGSKMEAIFSNCILCISATSGFDGSSGCYSPEAAGRLDLESHLVTITSVLSTGQKSTLYVYCEPSPSEDSRATEVPSIIRESPTMTRGWMCQERILPPRILHFTTEQLIWECGDGYQSEDGLESWFQKSCISTNLEYRTGPRLAHELANVQQNYSPFEVVFKWYQDIVADDYSRRVLSKPQDKLAAVSGLARLVSRSTQSRYIAGLWECGLCYGLCWTVNAPPSPLQKGYRAPSFSWASVGSQVSWQPGIYSGKGPPSSLFTVLAWRSVPATSDEFGGVSMAALKITGQFKSCRVRPCHVQPWPNDSNVDIIGARNKPLPYSRAWIDTSPSDEHLLSMLACTVEEEPRIWYTYAILIEPVIQHKGIYKRKGLATFYGKETFNQEIFPGKFYNDTITMI